MARNRVSIRIRNILLIIFIILSVLSVMLYFLLSLDMSLAIIAGSFLAFAAFAATLVFYRWISLKRARNAVRYIIFSFAAKIIFLGAMLYLITKLDMINIIAFAISFIVFFTIFLYIEVFVIYKKLIFK